MKPWLQDPDLTVYHGDALACLREMESESVDCCVTSPPYWGLRDYGTDGQLGLEATPDEYVARLVEVFGEVRRCLTEAGTVWLNLGSSYMASPRGNAPGDLSTSSLTNPQRQDGVARGSGPSQFLSRRRALAYGSDDITLPDSNDPGSAYLDLCDGCLDDFQSRHASTARSDRQTSRSTPLVSPTTPSNGTQGESEPLTLPHDAQVSTTLESSEPPPALCWRCGTHPASVALRVEPTSSADAPTFSHTGSRTIGTSQRESDDRSPGRDAGGMEWVNYTSRLKQKDMVPIPWMVAMALQADGWWLRSDIIWSKPNPMPESVTDRPTKAHEYVFLLSKSARYYFDQEAVREPAEWARWGDQTIKKPQPGTANWIKPKTKQELVGKATYDGFNGRWTAAVEEGTAPTGRNVRSVWEIPTQPYAEAHFAVFPEELPRRCILAGCPIGGTVLDPFAGSGTTGLVARRHNRKAVLIELNEDYCELIRKRLQQLSLFADAQAQQ